MNLKSSILKLRKEGKSVNQIADTLNCAKSTVSYHINKIGLGGSLMKSLKDCTDDEFLQSLNKQDINAIVSLRNKKKSIKEIMKLLNMSRDKVSRVCRIYNLSHYISRNAYRQPTEKDIELFINLYNKEENYQKIANETGFTRSTVRKYISHLIKKSCRNEEEKKRDNVKYVNEARRRRKLQLVKYKGGECQCCGYKKSHRSLQFHHIDPSKKSFTIGGRNYSWEIMKKEVDKCALVCSNCHGEIHDEIDDKGYSDIVNNILNK